jgi:hypothetical protein
VVCHCSDDRGNGGSHDDCVVKGVAGISSELLSIHVLLRSIYISSSYIQWLSRT